MIRTLIMLSLASGAIAPSIAQAQYYPPRDDRPYDRPYEAPPPYRYDEPRPRYYDDLERRRPVGFRCDATAATPRGPRQIVCPLERPRPLGFECECPPPPPPPGFSAGPDLPGRVIR